MRKSQFGWMKQRRLEQLIRLATDHADSEAGQAALDYAIDELLVVEVEHRMVTAQVSPGHAPTSAVAQVGQGSAATTPRASQVEVAASRLGRTNPWRPLALELLAQANERQQRAALIRAFLIPSAGKGPRALQMLPAQTAMEPENQRRIYQVLGWPPEGKLLFSDGRALRNAASVAKKKMRAALLDKLLTAAMA
ncbi:hypothetical protein [Halomonas sp. H10-9-1]|uniref:hypothetical protein n=1 Tax=Halomonas sp. H10-9-1 TaxID=2950871 RepID=UPI0032DEA7CE